MASGPQRYPGANTSAAWYQGVYGGDDMNVNVIVLHTTEGRTLPGYGGGGSAPNLTAVPDFTAKRLKWYQHFDIERSSRALQNLTGGVTTNTNNVCQVELVGTCDPTTHKRWGSAQHIFWPEAPDWALRDLADFLAWMHAQHGVPLTGPSKWPAYPASYGSSGGQRMSGAQWNAFRGVCGHMHVTENDHGDPGAIDFTRLIALAKGVSDEEDDVAITDADIEKIARKVLTLDGVIVNATGDPVNTHIALASAARNIETVARRTEAKVSALSEANAKLIDAVALLASNVAGLDPAAIVTELREALESLTVHLDVT